MNKTLKTIGAIGFAAVTFFGLVAYVGCGNAKQRDVAREKADFFIDNLDNPNAIAAFPIKADAKQATIQNAKNITEYCDWRNRDGKFVDAFRQQKNSGGQDEVDFIYEYYLDCDSLRFVLSFDAGKNPELTNFHFEQIEVKNPKVLFPEKQLKNR